MKRILALLYFAGVANLSAQDTTRLSLLFLGDIMQHDSQIADALDPVSGLYDYGPCFQHVKPYTFPVDLAIGNLELTLAGPPYKGYPQFSAPDALLTTLKNIGMDVLVTANNHCADRGKKGLERTLDLLDSMEILRTGTFRDEVERLNLSPLLIERKGFRLALLNYTYGTNGMPVYRPNVVNMLDTAVMRKDLDRARAMDPDAIIVFTHWGAEYQSLPSSTQRKLAEFCFEKGADIVIGAHPHVIQPMEWHKDRNKLVAYSLGNFVSGQRKRYTDGGAMIRIELEKIVDGDASTTKVDTAGYVLQWVQRTRDEEKNYFILPVPTVETNPAGILPDERDREAYSTFVEDSRSLMRTHNENVEEFSTAPQYDLRTDRVSDPEKLKPFLDKAISIQTEGENILFGPFTLEEARFIEQSIEGAEVSILKRD